MASADTGLSLLFFLLLLTATSNAIAETKLNYTTMHVGSQKIKVEIVRDEAEQMRGLMYRKTLCDNCGMLFVYTNERKRSFWMKNTFIALSIGFFNSNKELVDVQEMEPVVSEMQTNIPTYESAAPAMYALEMPKGWFKKNNIRLKTKFSF